MISTISALQRVVKSSRVLPNKILLPACSCCALGLGKLPENSRSSRPATLVGYTLHGFNIGAFVVRTEGSCCGKTTIWKLRNALYSVVSFGKQKRVSWRDYLYTTARGSARPETAYNNMQSSKCLHGTRQEASCNVIVDSG